MVDRTGIVIESPDTFEVEVLLEKEPALEGLLGRMVCIKQKDRLVLGYITKISSFNQYHNTERLKQIKEHIKEIKDRFEEGEIYIAKVELFTALVKKETFKRIPLNFSIVPGNEVFLVEQELRELMEKEEFDSLGLVWQEKIKHLIYIKDFSEEAYHTLITGKSGSGKSSLAVMLLSLYAKRSKDMSFIIIDPVGEFTKAFRGQSGTFPAKKVWENLGRDFEIIEPGHNFRIDKEELFIKATAITDCFEVFNIGSQKYREAATKFLEILQKERNADLYSEGLEEYTMEELCSLIWKEKDGLFELATIYSASNRDKRQDVHACLMEEERIKKFQRNLNRLIPLFHSSKPGVFRKITEALNEKGKTIIVNISSVEEFFFKEAEKFKAELVAEICKLLYKKARNRYMKEDKSLNTLILLDEAHRFVPSSSLAEDTEEQNRVSQTIKNSIIETRKFGLGWFIISTRPSNLDRRIFEETRNKFFGFGLHTGSDADLIREYFRGKDVLSRYANLPDPEDVLSEGKSIGFMVHGPITVLSREHPEFIKMYSFEEFLKQNKLDKPQLDEVWSFFE